MISKRRKVVLALLTAIFLLCLTICVDEQARDIVKPEFMRNAIKSHAAESSRNFSVNGQLLTDFPYEFLIDEPRFCEEDLQVVNMMPISVGDAASRARVRGMWGAKEVVASTRLRPLFLVGESRDAEQQRRLQEESDEYHDVIQVGFVDAYLNLTLKTLSALHWKHTRCPHVPWLLKSDADVFMNPWAVSEVLQKATEDIVCRVLYSRIVCRPHNCKDKRWIIPPELYPHDHYPPYCNGPVYAVNQNFVRKILRVAPAKNSFPMEDAYFTGILAQGLDLRYQDVGNRCQLYRLKHPPHESVASGKTLFVVNPEEKSGRRYTLADLWRNLVASRASRAVQR